MENDEQSEEERSAFEEGYYTTLSKIERLISAGTASVSISSNQSNITGNPTSENRAMSNDVRLPEVELPSFNGSYDSWSRFRDTFESLIHHNLKLSEIQKIHYLLSSVQGEAAEMIDSVEISAANYQDAWSLLKNRYDNKRLIIQENIKALFDLPTISKENFADLRVLVNGVRNRLSALKRLQRPVDSWDDIIIHIVTAKLDRRTDSDWEETLGKSDLPTVKQLMDFLDHKCETLESVSRKSRGCSVLSSHKNQDSKNSTVASKHTFKKRVFSHVSARGEESCKHCKGSHSIYRCSAFLQLSVEDRLKQVRSIKICTNCLRSSAHTANTCIYGACSKCNKKHNTILHLNSKQPPRPKEQENETTAEISLAVQSTSANLARQQPNSYQVLLPTAIVEVYDKSGHTHRCRALLDSGSQSNFISRELAVRLGLLQRSIHLPIAGIGNSVSHAHTITEVRVKSRFNAFTANIDCLVLNKITQDLPVSSSNMKFDIPQGIKLADPEFSTPAPIELLIGAEIFWDLICVGQIKASREHPALQKTHLGWIVSGKSVGNEEPLSRRVCNIALTSDIHSTISKFWQLEHNPDGNTLSPEERYCEKYYDQTVTRNQEGRFIVRLSIKRDSFQKLGESKDIAKKRFLSLEKKLEQNPDLKKQYAEFIHEYRDLGHMQQVNDTSSSSPSLKTFYLPHHPVIKETSTTTKLRVVFDGSCKSSTGISLNNALMVGPTLQQDLFSILVRFRTFQITLKADIAKMYRQVLVNRSETPLQRILWRDSPDDDIQTYELLTVTYGTASGSYLAIKSLQHLAALEKDSFPDGAAILLRDQRGRLTHRGRYGRRSSRSKGRAHLSSEEGRILASKMGI